VKTTKDDIFKSFNVLKNKKVLKKKSFFREPKFLTAASASWRREVNVLKRKSYRYRYIEIWKISGDFRRSL